MRYFASLLVRYENAVASHSLEFAAQNAMRYRLSTTLVVLFIVPRFQMLQCTIIIDTCQMLISPAAAAVSAALAAAATSDTAPGTPSDCRPTSTLSVNDDDSLPVSVGMATHDTETTGVVVADSDDVIGICELTTPDNITSCNTQAAA